MVEIIKRIASQFLIREVNPIRERVNLECKAYKTCHNKLILKTILLINCQTTVQHGSLKRL